MFDLKQINNIKSMLKEYRAHILYIYNEIDKYIANAFSFILEGLAENEVVAFVDTSEVVAKVTEMMKLNGLEMTSFPNLIVRGNNDTYLLHNEFDINQAESLIRQIKPYLENGHAIRTWGNVPFPEVQSTLERIKVYENISDELISHNRMISVCAYNGFMIPAYVQNELMKSHMYFMTDDDFGLSPLYQKDHNHFSSSEEIERLRVLQKYNQELSNRNYDLMIENNLVKIKNEMVVQSEQKLRHIINQLPIPTIIRKGRSVLFLNCEAHKHFCTKNGEEPLQVFFKEYDELSENRDLQKHQVVFS